MDEGRWPKECGQPVEVGKGEEMDCPLKLLEETHSCQHLNFHPVRPSSDQTTEFQGNVFVLSH